MSADGLSRAFAALADPTRRDMVARLANGDATVNQLAEPYRMSLQAVYKHLKVLEEAGLVTRPPGPQPRSVRLERDVFDEVGGWIEQYRRRAEARYQRLDAVLAAMDERDAERPDAGQLDGAQPDAGQPDGGQPDGGQPDGERP